MPMDFSADAMTFFNPDEFGVAATIAGAAAPVIGIPSTYSVTERPGSTSGSRQGAFLVGAADINQQTLQFMCWEAAVVGVAAEASLTIAAGRYAGSYRIREIQRNGDLATLIIQRAAK